MKNVCNALLPGVEVGSIAAETFAAKCPSLISTTWMLVRNAEC